MTNSVSDHGHILVLVRDADLRQWLVGGLSAFGHRVELATDIAAAEQAALSAVHDLLILDLEEALRLEADSSLLRRLAENCPELPVITVSALEDMVQAIAALKVGAVDHLVSQSCQPEVLRHSVQRALDGGRLLRQNRQYRQQLEAANSELERSLELLQEDQEAGRRVQFRLLPQTPFQVHGCTVSHRIYPSLYLSGDFVDYFKVGEHKLGFYLADVSGHGAASAFVTVFLKAVTNRLQRHYERRQHVQFISPSRVLEDINGELLTMRMGKHLAMFCGVIDLENNTLKYSVAAHYPPPLLVSGQEVVSLAGRGLPLGLFKDARYDEHVVPLLPGFTLIATSDGVLEVLPKGTANDKEKQLQEMAMHVKDVDDLVKALRLSRDAALPDDVALLVIHRASV